MNPPIAKPRPVATPATQPFWDALNDGRIEIQHCSTCDQFVHYPRSRCSHCLADTLSFREVDGTGTVVTFSIARQATAAPFVDDVPQIIAIVQLDCGVRVTTNLVDVEPDDVAVGLSVEAVFDHGDDGMTLLRFRPS